LKFKRGYANGTKVIEIIDGEIDLVLYNEKTTSFYFYRFRPQDVLKDDLPEKLCLVTREQVEPFLATYDIQYEAFIEQLLTLADSMGLKAQYEM
jgi:hypothetical protein